MLDLIKEPILDNPNFKKKPKILVLQHCRGEEHIDYDSDSDNEMQTDGAVMEYVHRMVRQNGFTVQFTLLNNKTHIICDISYKLCVLRMTQLFSGQHLRAIQLYELNMGQYTCNISSSA